MRWSKRERVKGDRARERELEGMRDRIIYIERGG